MGYHRAGSSRLSVDLGTSVVVGCPSLGLGFGVEVGFSSSDCSLCLDRDLVKYLDSLFSLLRFPRAL